MAKKKDGPLNNTHLDTLNRVIQACTETADYCSRCEACGLDVEPEKRKNAEQLALAQKLKGKFFPDAK